MFGVQKLDEELEVPGVSAILTPPVLPGLGDTPLQAHM